MYSEYEHSPLKNDFYTYNAAVCGHLIIYLYNDIHIYVENGKFVWIGGQICCKANYITHDVKLIVNGPLKYAFCYFS